MDHAVLDRLTAGGRVGDEQLGRLAEAAALPDVDLRVVPLSAWTYTGLDGAFTIFGFPGTESDIVFVESPRSESVIDRAEQVRAYRLAFDDIAGRALDPAESVEYIRRCRAEPARAAWR